MKNAKNKSILMLATLLFVISLVGCGKKEEAPTIVDSTNDTAIEVTTTTEEAIVTEEIVINDATSTDAVSDEFDYNNPLEVKPDYTKNWSFNGANVDWYTVGDFACIWDYNSGIKMKVNTFLWDLHFLELNGFTFHTTTPADGEYWDTDIAYCAGTSYGDLDVFGLRKGEIYITDMKLASEDFYNKNVLPNKEGFFASETTTIEMIDWLNAVWYFDFNIEDFDYDEIITMDNGMKSRTIKVSSEHGVVQDGTNKNIGYVRIIMPEDGSHCYFIYYSQNPKYNSNYENDTLECINSIQFIE